MNEQDAKFMLSALKLAEKGIGSVEPNPAVGCLIVKAGQLVGKGYHKKFGGPHAEVNAIEDCRNLSVKPEGATMYVTLEPCCHHGKTGPCTEAILAAQIARVVVAVLDPSPHAGGKGVERLRQAGVEVEVGLCEDQARRLNAPFFKHTTTGRCWVVLKWAQSLDGKLAYTQQGPERRWISERLSRKDARKRLRACDPRGSTRSRRRPAPATEQGQKAVVLDSTLQLLKSLLHLRRAVWSARA